MNMDRDDGYLWAKTEPCDDEVASLERLLSRYAHQPRPRQKDMGRKRTMRVSMALAATLALCVAGMAAWFQQRLAWQAGEAWRIVSTSGQVLVQGDPDGERFVPGSEIITRADGSARIGIARIGDLRLEPGSRLRLEQTRSGHHRVRLLEGRLQARVWAPSMHFGVELPGAEVLDLGCEFIVASDAAGNGELTVLSGWVLVDTGVDEVLVPRNATVALRGGLVGIPHDLGASTGFMQALRAVEGGDPAGIGELVATSRPEDAISLLALLQRNPALARGPVYERLRQLLPEAQAVDRDAILRRDPHALDPWWDALPYPRAKRWWLHWKDALPARDPTG